MRNYTEVAVALLASVLVLSLATVGQTPYSFAATERPMKVLGAQLIPSENDFTIDSITLFAKGKPDRATGVVEIFEDGELVGSATIDPSDLHKKKYREVTVQFSPAVEVDGDFKVQVTGKSISVKKDKDSRDNVPGYYLVRGNDAKVKYDLRMQINTTPLANLKEALGYESGISTPVSSPNTPSSPTTPGEQPATPQTPSGDTSLITIDAKKLTAKTEDVAGMYVAIMKGSQTVTSGWTPLRNVELTNGETYTILVDQSWGTFTFAEWDDTKSKANTRTEVITQDKTFTALYSTPDSSDSPDDSTAPPPGEQLPPGDAATVTVNSELLDETPISGYYVQLRNEGGTKVDEGFTPVTFKLESGKQYRVVMYSAGDTFFRHFEEGTWPYRYKIVSATDSGQVFTAVYEHVPSSQQARLQVVAKTTTGEIIGSTTGSDVTDDLQASPGMEVKLAPPGTLTPYTSAFTGSSSLPFVLYEGQTYTAIMGSFGKYQFAYWEDNGGAANARAFQMNGDITAVAVYNVIG